MNRVRGLALVILAYCMAIPAVLGAQQQKPDSAATNRPSQPAELVFEREVFTYPTFQRRNPFQPLTGSSQGGPRFDQLRLMGIVYQADDPSSSVAMVGTSAVRMSTDSLSVSVTPQGQTWYLKIGQSVGSIRVVEIHRDQVVVEVEEFGLTERKIMRMDTRGGTQ